jgi:thiol:disulfide interchange protein
MSKGEVVSFDSGVFAVLLTLGWIGSLVYVGGLIWLLIRIFRSERHVEDLLVTTLTGIVFAFMGMMIFLNQLNGVTGVVLWPLLSLALVTVKQKYAHNNERAPA